MSDSPENTKATEVALRDRLVDSVRETVESAETETSYRQPLVGFARASDARFADLKKRIGPHHALPEDLLPGARSVVSFFLPFSESVVDANRRRRGRVAREWAVAYVETNELLGKVCERLTEVLREHGFEAASAPATGNFDRETLESGWSHKSVAVIAGLGKFGLHQMVITRLGCAGRFGSLVTDAEFEPTPRSVHELCIHFAGGTCADCVARCPVGALNGAGSLNRQLCWRRCSAVAERFENVGLAEVCGKCAVGRCALEAPRKGDRSRARRVP